MKLLNKAESFMHKIAGDDEGLRDELDRIGVVGVLASAVCITVFCGLILTAWVTL